MSVCDRVRMSVFTFKHACISETREIIKLESLHIIKRPRAGRVETQQLWQEFVTIPKSPVYKLPLTTAPETNVSSLAKHLFLLLLPCESADLRTIHLHQSNYPNTQPTQEYCVIDPAASHIEQHPLFGPIIAYRREGNLMACSARKHPHSSLSIHPHSATNIIRKLSRRAEKEQRCCFHTAKAVCSTR